MSANIALMERGPRIVQAMRKLEFCYVYLYRIYPEIVSAFREFASSACRGAFNNEGFFFIFLFRAQVLVPQAL